jgi:hypothetical protein
LQDTKSNTPNKKKEARPSHPDQNNFLNGLTLGDMVESATVLSTGARRESGGVVGEVDCECRPIIRLSGVARDKTALAATAKAASKWGRAGACVGPRVPVPCVRSRSMEGGTTAASATRAVNTGVAGADTGGWVEIGLGRDETWAAACSS